MGTPEQILEIVRKNSEDFYSIVNSNLEIGGKFSGMIKNIASSARMMASNYRIAQNEYEEEKRMRVYLEERVKRLESFIKKIQKDSEELF